MIRKILSFLLLLLGTATAYAQYENVWAFGTGLGLDFNSGIPALITTNMNGQEGTASVCNSSGQLLFYTEGSIVWNRNGNIMPNGTDLVPGATYFASLIGETPTFSSSQSSVIIPMIGDENKYYIFSHTSSNASTYLFGSIPGLSLNVGQLYYSILDMNLNGGLGDIVAGEKGIFVDSGLAESVTAVVGDRCNIWVVASTFGQNIKAWEITAEGVDATPVLSNGIGSTVDSSNFYIEGCIVVSPNRKKLAVTFDGFPFSNTIPTASAATLYDFDPATGIVTNGLPLYSFRYDSIVDAGYGICFSPDNSKLYVQEQTNQTGGAGNILQYDLSSNTPAIIPTTSVNVGSCNPISHLKYGPDGKIYFLNDLSLGYIGNPNASGLNCDLASVSLDLPYSTAYATWGLPNVVPVFNHDTAYFDTTIQANCALTTIALNAKDTNGRDYYWSNEGTSPSIIIDTPGTYWVQYYTAPCTSHADTFVVKPWRVFTLNPMPDTTVCQDKYIVSLNIQGATYLWSDSSKGNQLVIDTTGTYTVQVTKDGCTLSDTMQVNIVPIQGVNLGDDIDLCTTDVVQIPLQVNLPSYISLVWSTGDITPGITATDTGAYWVQASYLTCTNADTIVISKDLVCDCQVVMPTAFTPNNDGLNDLFRPVVEKDCPIDNYKLEIYNRWGQQVYSSFSAEGGWDGTFNGQPVNIGTYMYQISFTVGTKKRPVNYKGDVTLVR